MKTRREAVPQDSDDLRPEYVLKGGQRNPYAARMKKGTNIVLIEPELYPYFPDSESVNEALRLLVRLGSKEVKKATKHAKAS